MALPCLRGSASTYVARNPSIQALCASFSTSFVVEAAVKKPAKKVVQKRKTARKPVSSGPRSSKQRSGAAVDAGTGISTSNPFLATPIKMSQLPDFLPESATPENLNQAMAWTKRTLEATRIQGFGLTREIAKQFKATPRPRSVLRQASLDLFGMLDKSSASSSSSSSNLLLQGSTGSGTSTLLLQCFSYALESSWIVIYIPRTINLVDSSSPYSYNEALQTYLQPEIARNLLQKILANNESSLSKLDTGAESITLDGGLTLQPNTTITKAIQAGFKTETTAAATQQILELTMKIIIQQKEIPVLMAIDGAQALFSKSRYRDADYRELQSYELAVPRILQTCLRKDGPGSYGGVQRGKVLASFSLQHSEWPVPLEVQAGARLQSIDAYAKLDETMLGIVEDCRFDTMEIASALTMNEAASLAELARDEGGRWTAISDEFFMSKLVESGGNIGTFDRSLRKSTL